MMLHYFLCVEVCSTYARGEKERRRMWENTDVFSIHQVGKRVGVFYLSLFKKSSLGFDYFFIVTLALAANLKCVIWGIELSKLILVKVK